MTHDPSKCNTCAYKETILGEIKANNMAFAVLKLEVFCLGCANLKDPVIPSDRWEPNKKEWRRLRREREGKP